MAAALTHLSPTDVARLVDEMERSAVTHFGANWEVLVGIHRDEARVRFAQAIREAAQAGTITNTALGVRIWHMETAAGEHEADGV